MSSTFHSVVNWLLIAATAGSMLLAAILFFAAIVGWKGPRRNRRLAALGMCLIAIPVLAGLQRVYFFEVYRGARQRERAARLSEWRDETSRVRVGDAAPGFELVDTAAEEFSLEGHRGKVVLVNFFATWCKPCLMELPHLEKLWQRRKDHPDFAMIVIGLGQSKSVVTAFQEQSGYVFRMAPDPDGSVAAKFGAEGIPRTYLVSRDGRIAYQSLGFSVEEVGRLEVELDKQLGGR